MPDEEGKKIEIEGPVQIVIGSKEEKKKASSMPTKCKDGEDIYYNAGKNGITKFFNDEFNKSTQKGFLKSITEIPNSKIIEEYLNICRNKIGGNKATICNKIIPTPSHCGKPMIIIKVDNKPMLTCSKCKISSQISQLLCSKCNSINVSSLMEQTKTKKIKRIAVSLEKTEEDVYLCPEGTIFNDLKLALYKTSKGKPTNILRPKNPLTNDQDKFFPTKNIYVKFRQFDPKTGKKEVRTSIRPGKIKFLKINRSWEISPLGLPKGTVRSFLLLMVFLMFLGFFLPELDKFVNPIQVEVLILLIVVFIPSLLDKLDIKEDYKTGGKLTFLGGAGIFGWLTFQEFFEANTFNLIIAPLFILVGIALRKAVNEVVDNHPVSGTKTYLTLLANHLLALGVLVYVGLYVYFNLALGAENIEDIWHFIFAIYTSFYVSERLFEQDVKIKATYYPEKVVTSTE